MYEYKSELLDVRTKWFNDSADEKYVAKLDEFLNERISEGWELVTYSYMTNVFGSNSTFCYNF